MSHKLTQTMLMIASLIVFSMVALADPGVQTDRIVSDQKAGSVLVYNIYTSSATNPGAENTRISLTNTDDVRPAAVHLFYVDGSTCSVADNYICLTKSQTTSFLASDVDPGTTGYLVAIATDSRGIPVQDAKLIGDEYVKFASGHIASLGAEVISRTQQPDSVSTADMTATIFLVLPRVLAVANIPSIADGNNTRLIINRVSGDLRTSGFTIGGLFGLVFDELENGYSFNFTGGCQINRSLGDGFPRTAPRLSSIIPAGSTGWAKFWRANDDAGILGAVINFNPNAGTNANAYNAGHNLHKLTYTNPVSTNTNGFIVPTFPNMCAYVPVTNGNNIP